MPTPCCVRVVVNCISVAPSQGHAGFTHRFGNDSFNNQEILFSERSPSRCLLFALVWILCRWHTLSLIFNTHSYLSFQQTSMSSTRCSSVHVLETHHFTHTVLPSIPSSFLRLELYHPCRPTFSFAKCISLLYSCPLLPLPR